MPWRNPPNRSTEYRHRAEECRVKAEATKSESERRTMLENAELWERMADYEDKNNPPVPVPGLAPVTRRP